MLFDIGTGVEVDLGQNIFDCIAAHLNGKRRNQKLPFPTLIYGILLSQKELREGNEYLIPLMKTVSYKMKEKVKSQGEGDDEVVPEPTIVARPATYLNIVIVNAPSLDLSLFS